uniref:lipid II flippase Amj family protein n=1 Tax=Methylobacterium sp. B34 TaxID=95563 RepID=UPI0003453EBD|nr:lipid II flippase Amj family protein [Methylobacterium sp. B34]
MDSQLLTICLLTAAINLIGTLAYAARIAGVRTRRIAISFALFNILVLISRTSNGFLGPLIAKRIENRLAVGGGENLSQDFRIIIVSSTIAVIAGIILIPSGQRLFTKAINFFQRSRSTSKLLARMLTPSGAHAMAESLALPKANNVPRQFRSIGVSWSVLLANVVVQALLTVGVLASLYAGYLEPSFRVTASQLSAIINGVATILLFVLIDPQLSVMTDDAVEGRVNEATFRRTVVWVSLSRLIGTCLAQVLFLPAALCVAWVASRM